MICPGSAWLTEFSLAPIEQDICCCWPVAPEIDLKYETLFAYLNNDVTRKWPTCDLALRLLSTHAAQQLHMRRYLMPESTLFASGLLQPIHAAPTRPAWLASGFSVSPSVPPYLLGFPARDPRLARCRRASDTCHRLAPGADSRAPVCGAAPGAHPLRAATIGAARTGADFGRP